MKTKIRLFKKSPGYCGPTSLRIVLDYYGIKKSEKELARLIGATRENGSDPWQIVEGAKKLGLVAYYKKESSVNELKKLLKLDILPIVDWNPKEDYGQYSIVASMDNKSIRLSNPDTCKIDKIPLKEFNEKWYELYGNKKVKGELIVVENPKQTKQYRPAVFIVVYKRDGKTKKPLYILLKRKLHWKGWEFPKGGIDKGEKPIKTAARETKEETGLAAIKIKLYKIKGKYLYHKLLADRPNFKGQTFQLFSAEVKQKPNEKIKLDPKEHSSYVWLPFQQAIKKLTWKNQKKCLRIVNRDLR